VKKTEIERGEKVLLKMPIWAERNKGLEKTEEKLRDWGKLSTTKESRARK
jgi:hypothetical protein